MNKEKEGNIEAAFYALLSHSMAQQRVIEALYKKLYNPELMENIDEIQAQVDSSRERLTASIKLAIPGSYDE